MVKLSPDRLDVQVVPVVQVVGLPVSSKGVFHGATGKPLNSHQTVSNAQNFDSLPMELTERLLLNSFMTLFLRHLKANHYVSVAERATYKTLAGVCSFWWQSLNGWPQSDTRMWLRHKLQRLMGFVCRPYLCRPLMINELTTKNPVRGVTQLDDLIFVICRGSDEIKVFGAANKHIHDITVSGLKEPQDIVACTETRSLYVASRGWLHESGCVWRGSADGQFGSFLPGELTTTVKFRPQSLSVRSSRLLVTTDDALLHFRADSADQLNAITIPEVGLILHAVETSRGTFVACHQVPRPGVVEVDADGHVMRAYDDQQDIGVPWYLVFDAEGRIMVADFIKHRISLLTDELRLDRVLLDLERDRVPESPCRLCYRQQTHQLAVSSYWSTGVIVFTVG